jgi:hypothetical protein
MSNLLLTLLPTAIALGFILGVLVTRRVKSAHLRVQNGLLRDECEDYRALTDSLKLEVRLIHDALKTSEQLAEKQADVIRRQGAVIEEARGVGQAMIAAMDAELIVRDEQGRVMLEQGFIE